MGKTVFIIGGTGNMLIGLLHVAMVFIGPNAYVYFGAGQEFADKAAQGSLYPTIATLILAAVFMVFGLYAFSGAAIIRRLPLLNLGLWGIGIVYFLRGLALLVQLWLYLNGNQPIPIRDMIFSAVALGIGSLYLFGANRLRRTR